MRKDIQILMKFQMLKSELAEIAFETGGVDTCSHCMTTKVYFMFLTYFAQ